MGATIRRIEPKAGKARCSVQLRGDQIHDRTLTMLSEIKCDWALTINGPFTDESVKRLFRLRNLNVLSLMSCAVTDDGLDSLKELKRLESLSLIHTKVSGRGFKHLGSLPNLESLSIIGGVIRGSAEFTDEGMAQLSGMPKLRLRTTHKRFGKYPTFAMLGLSLDESREAPLKYASRHNLTWGQGYLGPAPASSAGVAYAVGGLPSLWLIGPEGKLLARDSRGDEIDAVLTDAMSNK
jgi:hypothetical protein